MSARRILFLSHYALPHLGGIEAVIDAAARELARRGNEVTHLAADSVTAGVGFEPPTEYRVRRLPVLNALETRLGVPYPVFGPALVSTLRREIARADVVHAHGFLYLPSTLGLALARRGGRAIRVLTEHVGHVEYGAALNRVEAAAIGSVGRATARNAEGLISMNPAVAQQLERLVPGRAVQLISNGVDTVSYRPAVAGERAALRAALGWDDVPRALFVGRLVAKKGLDAALAAAAASGDAFRLVVVGPGQPPKVLPPGVEVLGAVPPARVAELMRAADAFVLPSRGEGFPVTAQEAMASGLPTVLGEDPSYAPHIQGAGDGVLLVTPDGPGVAAALSALLGNEQRRSAAGEQAAAHARRHFTWGAAIDAHEDLYDRIATMRLATLPLAAR